uniref:Uncharacterized protein n=1 Tax=Solanum lycopersicum TaxID=4081 RepID=A0A3Q7HN93_SOLLC
MSNPFDLLTVNITPEPEKDNDMVEGFNKRVLLFFFFHDNFFKTAFSAECQEKKVKFYGRSRFDPSIPQGYFGNIIVLTNALCTAAKIVKNSLSTAVKLVQEDVKLVTDSYMKNKS